MVEFYKVNSNGKLETVDASTKSLHHRRSIMVVDEGTETIWLLNGSGISKKLGSAAQTAAEKMNADNGTSYSIISEFEESPADIINEILGNIEKPKKKSGKKKSGKKEVSAKSTKAPKTPKKSAKGKPPHVLLGDLNHKGPKIDEFQIEYFEEAGPESRDYLQYGIKFLNALQSYANRAISNIEFENKVKDIVDDIIND